MRPAGTAETAETAETRTAHALRQGPGRSRRPKAGWKPCCTGRAAEGVDGNRAARQSSETSDQHSPANKRLLCMCG